ncbi:retropepsin-like aspartic protease [Parapedobacter sp. 10938]|nr:retropepsin-like aspartic protease [Parapedobacter sp. 10938]
MTDQNIKSEVHFPNGLKVDTIPFSYSSTGHILVKVTIEGQDYHLGFDSGAQRTIFRKGIPLTQISQDSGVIMIDAYGDHYAASSVALDTLHIGRLNITGLGWSVQTDMTMDGILGGDVLRNLVWKIDFARRCIYVAKEVDSFDEDKKQATRFMLINNLPYVKFRVNGVSIEYLMDTGDNGCLNINNALQKIHPCEFNNRTISWYFIPQKNTPFEAYIHEPRQHSVIDTFSYTDGAVEIGNHSLNHEVVEFVPSDSPTRFGLDLLQRFDYVVLDYPGRKLHLGNPQHKSYRYLDNMTRRINSMGVQLSTDTVPIVTGISSLVTGKDILLKDTIVAIDGISFLNQPASFYSESCFMHDGTGVTQKDNRLNTEKGCLPPKHTLMLDQFTYRNDTATLSIKRGNRIHQVTLTRGNQFRYLPDTVIHFGDGPPLPGYVVKSYQWVNDERGNYYLLNTNQRPFREEDYR